MVSQTFCRNQEVAILSNLDSNLISLRFRFRHSIQKLGLESIHLRNKYLSRVGHKNVSLEVLSGLIN